MKTTLLDHVAIHVADVETSCAWYEKALRLEPMQRPAFNFPGAWYRLGENQSLHLIGERDPEAEPVFGHNRGNHYALMTDDMDEAESYLQSVGIEYAPRRTRPDGAYQIYLTDPDGHVIEVCTEPGTAEV
jgi:catechol 2,3-dioxygenase-like lactoylglutathione lyase family enzyme